MTCPSFPPRHSPIRHRKANQIFHRNKIFLQIKSRVLIEFTPTYREQFFNISNLPKLLFESYTLHQDLNLLVNYPRKKKYTMFYEKM
jgi:hypothetical protein